MAEIEPRLDPLERLTNDEFVMIGEALYGPRWRSDIALDLGYQPNTIIQIAGGKRPVPVYVQSKYGNVTNYLFRDTLVALLTQRIQTLEQVRKKIAR